jgi:hypothetical protein
MEDERVVTLLGEIRDLQRQHLESYREALRNQQEAIAGQSEALNLQRHAMSRVKYLIWGIVVVGLLIIGSYVLALL